MKNKIGVNANQKLTDTLLSCPQFSLRCKLGTILKDRGIRLQELSDLTGIRIASISELINMKRTTINIPQLVAIALVLRIDNISDLFEFIVPADKKEQLLKDQEIVDSHGMLPEQEQELYAIRQQRKNPPTD